MMAFPAPFQSVLIQWEAQGIRVMRADWTTNLQRHVGAQVEYNGDLCYAKLALANSADLDEPDMLEGMRREVWWSQVIQALRQRDSTFPFSAPRTLATNVNQQPFQDKVAWVIMEFIQGQPIVDWEPERTVRQMTSTEDEQFNRLFDAVINSLITLEKIDLRALESHGLNILPAFLPHGSRGHLDHWQRRVPMPQRLKNAISARLEQRARRSILARPERYVLGNGAFEIKNFWRMPDGQLVIMDNEFAGWYPKHDHLSYLYHRLYCNTMRPDLAKHQLRRYMHMAMSRGDFDAEPHSLHSFYKSFAQILRPRVLGGWYYDTVRRKLPPWHKKQRLRYGLLWLMLRGHYGKLSY